MLVSAFIAHLIFVAAASAKANDHALKNILRVF